MSTGALGIILVGIGQLIAMVVGIAKVGGWVRSVSNAVTLLNDHVVSDKVIHAEIITEVNDIKIELAQQKGYLFRRKSDAERNDERKA